MTQQYEKLLISDEPLQVLPSLAVRAGLNEAIILQQIHYWLNPKRHSGKVIDGTRWIFNSYQQWQEQFPFWTQKVIGDAIRSLEKQGALRSRQDLNAKGSDRSKWYTVNYGWVEEGENTPQTYDDDTHTYDGRTFSEHDDTQIVRSYNTETTTETTPEIAAPSAPQDSAVSQEEAPTNSKAQVNARRFAYWEAMVEAFGWTGPQVNSARGRALRELKTAFPDEQALQEIPLERFRAAAKKYAATTDPKFYSAARVIASMEARREEPPTNLKPYWDEYMKMTLRDRSILAENPNEKIRGDFMRTLTRILQKTPTLTPNDVMSALWQWDHSLNPIPGFDIWEQAVNTWLKSGRQDYTAERRKFHR